MKIILEIELRLPIGKSSNLLLDFIKLWHCQIIKISTRNKVAIIGIDWKDFRKIWGVNPKKGDIEVPAGTGDFIHSIQVRDIVG